MKKVKVLLLKSGRGNSGLPDLTITVSPEQLKNPPLEEIYEQSPVAVDDNPYYNNKAIMKQPLSNTLRSLDRGQIIVKPYNRKVKYAQKKRATVLLTSNKEVILRNVNIPYPPDEPNQWGIDDGTTYWDDTAKNSMKSIKVYVPDEPEVQREPKLYETKPSQRIFNQVPTLDDIKRNSVDEQSQKQDSLHYQTERIEEDKMIRFQEDFHDFKDNKVTTERSVKDAYPRLSMLKNKL